LLDNYDDSISESDYQRLFVFGKSVDRVVYYLSFFNYNFLRYLYRLCDGISDYMTALYCEGPPVDSSLPVLMKPVGCWNIWSDDYNQFLTKQALIMSLIVMVIYDKALPGQIRYLFPFFTAAFFYPMSNEPIFKDMVNEPCYLPSEPIITIISYLIPCFLIVHISRIDDQRLFYSTKANVATEETEIVEKHSSLLRDMFPIDVYNDHIRGAVKLCYEHKNIGLLFTDIVGFTDYSKTVDASGVLALLQNMFDKFDSLGKKLNLYKLCTIGDAYIATTEPWDAAHTHDADVDATKAIVEDRKKEMASLIYFAFQMNELIGQLARDWNIEYLGMRFGMHIGNCTGGIIGSSRLRYDMWGHDIEVGETMESSGVKNQINVTERVKAFATEHFTDDFSFKSHDQVLIQNVVYPSFIMEHCSTK